MATTGTICSGSEIFELSAASPSCWRCRSMERSDGCTFRIGVNPPFEQLCVVAHLSRREGDASYVVCELYFHNQQTATSVCTEYVKFRAKLGPIPQ
jgi:hypothetical protein